MVAQSLIDSVTALSEEDRFELLRHLQDSLSHLSSETARPPLSDQHQRILDSRLADLDARPDEGASWEDVRPRLERALDRP